MGRKDTAAFRRPGWLLAPLLLALLLLPWLFETLLGFESRIRWAWELCYVLLSLGLTAALWRLDRTGKGGWWSLPMALAAVCGAMVCRNPLVAVALGGLALPLLLRAGLPGWVKGLAGTGISLALLLAALRLTVLALFGGPAGPWVVPAAGGGAGHYASVFVTDPGAMGRVRYHATEQKELLRLADLCRIGLVRGRDSAPSGTGAYGYVVDAYFTGCE